MIRLSTLALSLAFASVAHAQPLVSTFDTDAEGWTVETRTSPAGAFALSATYTPDFVAGAGPSAGYIREIDPDNQWSFFRAPLAWSGDRSAAYAGQITYRTRTDALTLTEGRLVVLISASGDIISADAGLPPLSEWSRRTVRLREGHWHLGSNATGTLATEAQIISVLADLDTFYIGLEFGSSLAEEQVDLDDVLFTHCGADLNGDGFVNNTDVNIFISAFLAGEPLADFDANGLFNNADVNLFVLSFLTSC